MKLTDDVTLNPQVWSTYILSLLGLYNLSVKSLDKQIDLLCRELLKTYSNNNNALTNADIHDQHL